MELIGAAMNGRSKYATKIDSDGAFIA